MTFVASYFDPSMYSGRRFAQYDPQAGPFSQNGFDLEPRTIADLAGSEDIQSAHLAEAFAPSADRRSCTAQCDDRVMAKVS